MLQREHRHEIKPLYKVIKPTTIIPWIFKTYLPIEIVPGNTRECNTQNPVKHSKANESVFPDK